MKQFQKWQTVYYIYNQKEVREGTITSGCQPQEDICEVLIPGEVPSHPEMVVFPHQSLLYGDRNAAQEVLRKCQLPDEWLGYLECCDAKRFGADCSAEYLYSINCAMLRKDVLPTNPNDTGKVYIPLVMWAVYENLYLYDTVLRPSPLLDDFLENPLWCQALCNYARLIQQDGLLFWEKVRAYDAYLWDVAHEPWFDETWNPAQFHQELLFLSGRGFEILETGNPTKLLSPLLDLHERLRCFQRRDQNIFAMSRKTLWEDMTKIHDVTIVNDLFTQNGDLSNKERDFFGVLIDTDCVKMRVGTMVRRGRWPEYCGVSVESPYAFSRYKGETLQAVYLEEWDVKDFAKKHPWLQHPDAYAEWVKALCFKTDIGIFRFVFYDGQEPFHLSIHLDFHS